MEYRYIDLSHTIKDDLITYKGLLAVDICDFWTREDSSRNYEKGSSFHIGKMELVGNTGTYIDTPFHRYETGDDLSRIHLNQLTDLSGVLFHAPFDQYEEIDVEIFQGISLKNMAVLVHTGWDRFWGEEQYFYNHPYLTEASALYLAEQQVKLVGIDSYNIDDVKGQTRPVHSILLKNDISYDYFRCYNFWDCCYRMLVL